MLWGCRGVRGLRALGRTRAVGRGGGGLAWPGRFAGGLVGIALNNLPGGLRLLSGVFLPATGMTAGYVS